MTSPLREVRAEHLLCTHSSNRNGLITHKAGCSCGVPFEWYAREEEHAEHVDAMIVEHFSEVRQETLLSLAEKIDQRWGDPTSHDVAEWMRGGAL